VSEQAFRLRRVILTNDDGIDAPGLRVLEEVAATLASEVWIVAPDHDRSGTSHSISLHAPLRISQLGERRYAISGTPGDCVVMAVRHLMRDAPPDVVLSGINRGANVGAETVFSGTVGAAMTGMLLGFPSIALSQMFRRAAAVRWDTARALAPTVLRRLLQASGSKPMCLNVNFPDVPADQAGGLTVTTQGTGLVHDISVESLVDPRGVPYHWLRFERGPRANDPGTETAVIMGGGIAVTPLRFERTDDDAFESLRASLQAST
jgi:5'-nucleotidase